jgi:hypothetical protein
VRFSNKKNVFLVYENACYIASVAVVNAAFVGLISAYIQPYVHMYVEVLKIANVHKYENSLIHFTA